MEASGSLMASSAIADVNSSASMSAVLRMASSAMSDVNSFLFDVCCGSDGLVGLQCLDAF